MPCRRAGGTTDEAGPREQWRPRLEEEGELLMSVAHMFA